MKEMLIKFVAAIVAVFAPVHGTMITAFLLVFVDTVTGTIAAKKRNEVITSRRMGDAVKKIALYQTAIVLAFLTEKYMLGGTLPLVNMVAGLIGFNELLSVLENLNSISGKDLLKVAIDKIKNKAP